MSHDIIAGKKGRREMPAKLPHSSTEEITDLHKQMGCMNGILQLFERHHFLAGRRIAGNSSKKLTSGPGVNHGIESNNIPQKAKEKNWKEVMKETERVSTESSTTSFSSSSCSSTFSSVDCHKTAQQEPSNSCKNNFAEIPSEITSRKQPNHSPRLGQQSLDLRDFVKDSMYREAHGLSVKTTIKEDGRRNIVRHIDSPRPSQLCKSVKPRVPGLDGSLKVLGKPQEAPWTSRERKDVSLPMEPKDTRRFSYDGVELRDPLKSKTKLKELPRLSLDSKADSMRRLNSQSRPHHLLRDPVPDSGNNNKVLTMDQEPGSNKRPSGIVAKLMGLEPFPDSRSPDEGYIADIKSCASHFDSTSVLSTNTYDSKQSQVNRSPRIFPKDSASPRLRNANSELRSTADSRLPLESATWKQIEESSQKPVSMYQEDFTKVTNLSTSVYGDMEERLKELEFNKSGTNLRALKQILEAMQKSRETLEAKRDVQASDSMAQTSKHGSLEGSSKSATDWSHQSKHPISPTTKGASSPKKYESPVVIIKPANLVEKARNAGPISMDNRSGPRKLRTGNSEENIKNTDARKTKSDLTPRNNHLRDPCSRSIRAINKNNQARTLRSMQSLEEPQHAKKEHRTKSGGSPRTTSPRLQQNLLVMGRPSRPTIPSTDLKKGRRQSSTESTPVSQKSKPKSRVLQQYDDQLSETSSERINSSCHDAMSVKSESSISMTSRNECEVTSTSHFRESNDIYQQKDQKNKILAARLREDKSMAELRTSNLEQPSPVSVLDGIFYGEDSPSPVKKISNAFKEDNTLDEAEWNSIVLDDLLNKVPNLNNEFNRKEQENTMNLVHKLRDISSIQEETTVADTASILENTNQEHRYIAEIMLVSGILFTDQASDSSTIQLHPSGHLIDPNLFIVLERTKRSTKLQNDDYENFGRSKFNEKIQRKLIFDTVNEILVHKLASAMSYNPWISSCKSIVGSPRGTKLLKEVCSEIDCFETNKDSCPEDEDGVMSILRQDIMHQSENWTDDYGEVPGVVIDIERLIFKDLIVEVLKGEAVGLKSQQSKHCRQLFSR